MFPLEQCSSDSVSHPACVLRPQHSTLPVVRSLPWPDHHVPGREDLGGGAGEGQPQPVPAGVGSLLPGGASLHPVRGSGHLPVSDDAESEPRCAVLFRPRTHCIDPTHSVLFPFSFRQHRHLLPHSGAGRSEEDHQSAAGAD